MTIPASATNVASAVVAPPAAAPVPTPAAPAPSVVPAAIPGAISGDPWETLNETSRAFVQEKNWQEIGPLVESYMALEAFRGVPEAELARIPKLGDTAAWDAFYGQMGRPATWQEYDLGPDYSVPDGQIDMREPAHKRGLTQAQVAGLTEDIATASALQHEGTKAALVTQRQNAATALQHEWGPAYDQRVEAADRCITHFGWDDKVCAGLEKALGTEGWLKLSAQIGVGLGEHGMPPDPASRSNGAGAGFIPTPAEAEGAFRRWNSDPMNQARLDSEDRSVAIAANEERRRLLDAATPPRET